MGDVRYARPYARVAAAQDPAAAIQELPDSDVIAALAAAADERDPYLLNVLATEAQNRLLRSSVVVDTAVEGLVAMDREGRFLSMNSAAERLLGWSEAELAGAVMHDAIHYQDPDGLPIHREDCEVHGVLATGKPVRGVQTWLTRKDGRVFPAESSAAPVLREGEIVGAVVSFSDVTARREGEAALRESEDRLQRVLLALPAGVLLFDPEGRCAYSNATAERILGLTAEDLRARPLSDPRWRVKLPNGRPCPEPERAFARVVRTGQPVWNAEYLFERDDGSEAALVLSAAPLPDPATGKISAVVGAFVDVTARRRAETERAEVEARFRAVFEGAGIGIALVALDDGRTLAANRALREMLGYEEEEFRAIAYRDVTHADDRALDAAQVERLLRPSSKGPARYEKRFVRKDGSILRALKTISLVRDAAGDPAYLVGMVEDVTERKRVEEAVREQAQRLVLLVDQLPGILWTTDADLRFTSGVGRGLPGLGLEAGAVGAWGEYAGLRPAPLSGITLEEFFGTDDSTHPAIAAHRRALRGESVRYEAAVEGRVFDARVEPLRDDAGRIVGVVGIGLDATERNRAEAALRESERRLTTLLANLPGMAYRCGNEPSWPVELVSDGALAVTGYAPEDFTSGRVAYGDIVHLEDRDRIWREVQLALEKKQPFQITYRIRTADGREKWVWEQGRAVYSPDGEVLALEGFTSDITARVAAEAEVQRHGERLEDLVRERTRALDGANRELEAFSYSVSHDLRAPLRAIDYLAKVLEDDYAERLGADGREHLRRLRVESERGSALVNDLLALSRAARDALNPQRVDLSALAREVAQGLARADPARRVEWTIESGVETSGDPQLLRAVLENLLGNAWKYTSTRPLAIIAFGKERLSDGRTAFFVRDNGVGFDPAQADRLFRPFERLHAQTEFQGTGVGLATVRRIVERHGGRVSAKGKPGEGATFSFTLD